MMFESRSSSMTKTVREVLNSTLLLKQKKFIPMSPWKRRKVVLITETGPQHKKNKSFIQITAPKKERPTRIDVMNIVSIHSSLADRTINIVLANENEIDFKADSNQLQVIWVASLKVAMAKGSLFHVKHRRQDEFADEDSLLQFIDVGKEGAQNSDQVLMLSSPLDDITRYAWRVSQIRQFRITDLGVCIEFCPNCYKTHIPTHRSFSLFVEASFLNSCLEFICMHTGAASYASFSSFVSIYKIGDHQCATPDSPKTPPPPLPPKCDVRPLIPSRDHPRLGYLNGPSAKPFLWQTDMVCPYKITNKIVINDDGSISQESTILGHRGSTCDPNPLKPPRRTNQHQVSCLISNPQTNMKQNRSLCRNTSRKLCPPKYVKRPSIPPKDVKRPLPAMQPHIDTSNEDDEDYEDYELMLPLDYAAFRSVAHSVSVKPCDGTDSTDHDYINIQNILVKLDNAVPKSPRLLKPAVKKRNFTLLKTEFELSSPSASRKLMSGTKPIPRKRIKSKPSNIDSDMPLKVENLTITGNSNTNNNINTQTAVGPKRKVPPPLPVRRSSLVVTNENDSKPSTHPPVNAAAMVSLPQSPLVNTACESSGTNLDIPPVHMQIFSPDQLSIRHQADSGSHEQEYHLRQGNNITPSDDNGGSDPSTSSVVSNKII